RDKLVTGVQTCALPIWTGASRGSPCSVPASARKAFSEPKRTPEEKIMPRYLIEREIPGAGRLTGDELQAIAAKSNQVLAGMAGRSEERRVGKECRPRWS